MSMSMETKPLRGGLGRHSDVVTSVAFSPDGAMLISGSWDGLIKLWDVVDGGAKLKMNRVLKGKWDEVESVAFSPDGATIAGLGMGWDGAPFGAVTFWDRDGGRGRSLFQTPGKLDAMSFSADGKTLATAGGEGRAVSLWSVADGTERLTLSDHAGPVWSVAFSRVGPILAAASGNVPAMADPAAEDRVGEVKLWDLSADKPTNPATMVGHEFGAAAVVFSPDGTKVGSGGFDRRGRIWNATTGEELFELEGHSGWVAALDFSPDGATLATGSHDQTIRLWDVATGECVSVLRGHTGNVYSVAFSPDGRLLASGSLDGTVRLWDLVGDIEEG